jgi:3-dehydroquinate dehydratase-2
MTKKILLVLHGPNFNVLHLREADIYGQVSLQQIEDLCLTECQKIDIQPDFFQSNHEGALIDYLHENLQEADAILINAGAYTHTSLALHDALKLFTCPIVEIHLSDPEKRESFRHYSYISPLAAHIVKGRGLDGYKEAIEALDGLFSAS